MNRNWKNCLICFNPAGEMCLLRRDLSPAWWFPMLWLLPEMVDYLDDRTQKSKIVYT